jgi:CBS domain-containing protein
MRTGIQVSDAMTSRPVTVSEKTTIEQCAKIMQKNMVGSLIISSKGNVKGIISDQDIVRNVLAKGADPKKTSVKDHMEKNVVTIEPNIDIFDALSRMRDLNIKHLPVISNKKMVGLITQKDILKIQPSLFEILVDKLNLREIEKKPVFTMGAEGICQACGFYSKQMTDINGNLYCPKCKDDIEL